MLLCSIIGLSQTKNSVNGRKLRIGFSLGANYSNLQSKETLPGNAKMSNGVGFRFGVFMDYSIFKNFSFLPKSELSFNNSSIEFVNPDHSTYEIFPISLDFMTHFVFKFGNSKVIPYFLVGPNFKLPVAKKSTSSTDFGTNPDFAIDFGIGLEKRTKYYIFAPELRYSLGLLNINQNPTLQTLNFHNISLVLYFK